ncbi:L-serine ammonia-lyase, iron-sulfur-dependent subunit beta [Muricomes intestini]|jgi:L-serine dehydratase|uniref:L-serine deaminase n=1 Tax=Muricomes intestini TaxID=1796634 RepID=A0A4R3K887_9FIRM|nr:L-serine ammonia-lyase, iron-sulfur-dependent subunit beta [Muricomes intestini]TCS79130.1 L-serine dehydratase [Muricomes intestini]HAX51487.1 L-serine ammonia-lyase, iron-sulfur-dependent, subunit beta [Lachnospiraceae bacterium]HCR84887.1 L-serine ammonia-lyase, iron-sulfur-dependent, subunit beta [Lachnospiraceae bacterium]
MNIFDILGPVMVGPSSSHTAGAVHIGHVTRKLLRSRPVEAEIGLCGSFAATGKGHGTDKALVAGLLGMQPDDMRIPESFKIAAHEGLDFQIKNIEIRDAHPNTALLKVTGEDGRVLEVQASSLGGGRIMLNKLDGIVVNCTGECPTLIVHNHDTPGHVAEVTSMLAKESINIATLQLHREKRGGLAVMVIEIDQTVPDSFIKWLEKQEGIVKVTYIDREEA